MYCTYNVILRRVHVTAIGVGKQQILYICLCVCVCVRAAILTSPSLQSARALLYCYLWLLGLHENFRRYFINGTIFRKKLLNIKYVF